MVERTRPRSVQEITDRFDKYWPDTGRDQALAFKPRPSDIYVMTHPKCGTTWTQQIVHGLRSNGSMDFEEISCVVPWTETALFMGIDIEAEQEGPFRAFKTHFNWHDVPKGARYIIVTRHPYDVAVSDYKFFEGMFFDPGSIPLEDYVRERFIGGGRYWVYLASWWEHRNDPNVLALTYEDMHADLESAVRRIAAFLNIDPDPDLIALVVHQSSFAFMKAHEHQFDDHVLTTIFQSMLHLPDDGALTKVNTGKTGHAKLQLSPELQAELDAVWEREIAIPLGLKDYAAFREAVAQLYLP